MPHWLGEVTSHLRSAVEQVRQRSALNPALWLCGICGIVGLAGVIFGPPGMRIPFFCLIAVPVALAMVAYVYFMLNDPDRLQTEEFVVQQHALSIVEQKGGPLLMEPTSLVAITNPAMPKLPSGRPEASA